MYSVGSIAEVDLLHDFASTLPTLEGIADDNAWSDCWMNLDSPRLAEAVQPSSPPPGGAVLLSGAASVFASCAQQKKRVLVQGGGRVQPDNASTYAMLRTCETVCSADPMDSFASCFLLDPALPDCFEQAATLSASVMTEEVSVSVSVPCTPVKRSRSEMQATDQSTTSTPAARAVRTPQRTPRATSAAQRAKTASPKPPTTPKSAPRGGARARSGSLRPTTSNIAEHMDAAPAITLQPEAGTMPTCSLLVRSHSVPCKLTESPFSKPIPIFGGLFKKEPCFDEGGDDCCSQSNALDELNEGLQKVASPGLLPKMLVTTLSAPLPVLLTTAPKARPPASPLLLRRVQ
eukprot:jgi/Chlat1/8484/Chrsp80S07875